MAEDKSNDISIRHGMRWKLIVVMIGMIITLVVLLTALQLSAQKDSLNNALLAHSNFLKTQMHKQANKATSNISAHIEMLISTKQLTQANDFIRNVVRDVEDLRYVILMQGTQPKVAIGSDLNASLKQHILSGEVSAFAASQLQPMHHDFDIDGHGFMETVMPVKLLDKQWGVLRLGFSVDQLNANLATSQLNIDAAINSALTRSILTSLIFLIIGALGIYYFARRWTDPLRKLVHFSHQLASGDFSATAHINTRSDDEIGLLTAALEDMASSLKKSYAQLEEHSHTLEDQVEKRTRELAEARDTALAATRSKSEFLANMSHEIRTPMNAVIGMTHLALDSAHNEQQRNYLNNIHTASVTLLTLINDILDFSKIEAGKLKLEAMHFHLADVLNNNANVVTLAAQEKGLDLIFDYPADLPPLHGDSLRLGQVLLNLINNAVKFTEQGQVKVSVQVINQNNATIELNFKIADSGIGMNAAQQKNLFQAFSQADTSITRKYGGTGLGLAICKQLLELMHSEITVTSTLGKGSVFEFRICFELGSDDALGEHHKVQGIPADALATLQGARLLLVEDNEINQQVAEGLLARVGVSVMIAHHGKQALQILQDEDFDGILMDMQMPVMDGLEATRRIRADQRFHDLPIIAMTANAMPEDREKCLEAGMNDHLSKPVDPGLLCTSLMRWIKSSQIDSAERISSDYPATDHSPSSNVGASSKALDFGQIAGIDSNEGLARVAGNQQLYKKILCKFLDSQADAMEKIKQALAANNKAQAKHLSHALKGVSGNIAALPLHQAISKLDAALLSGQTIDAALLQPAETLLNALTTNLTDWFEHNEAISAADSGSDTGSDRDSATPAQLIHHMRHLLQDYNADAVNFIEDLNVHLSGHAEQMKTLRQHLDHYDFDAALQTLDKIEAGLT
ncbi:MAG: ATP-binding protein [Mariprofundus sp.]|nr:ATP-binding protein [Mariprofundus sp.]